MNESRRVALALSLVTAGMLHGAIAVANPGAERSRPVVERWTEVRPGVRHLERRGGPFAYHVVTVDLATEGLEVRATGEEDALPDPSRRGGHRWTRTSPWARRAGAVIAHNGNYHHLTPWR